MLTLATRRKSRWDRRRGRPKEEAVEPTPETKVKCRPDVLAMLHKAGQIDGAERQAGEDIRVCWELMTRGLFAADLDRTPGAASGKLPLERMTEDELHTYRTRYVPWAAVMGRITVTDGITRLQLILDVVWDGLAPVEVAGLYRLTGAEVSRHLNAGLRAFAESGG